MTVAQTCLFRTDASLHIGTGHVMRCLALANTLRERGADCVFICRRHEGHLGARIQKEGHQLHLLPQPASDWHASDRTPAHAQWLGIDWQQDAGQTQAVLADMQADWLVVDHYALDARWESALRPAVQRIMVIDDLADRPHDCDLMLDQNLGRSAADYASLLPATCEVLAGPHYALLRPEFAALRVQSLARRATPRLQRLLVTMGGVDKDNATGKVLEALRECPLPEDCRITVVMGPHAPWLQQVQEQAMQMPRITEVLVDVGDMARLMADCDLAIGAAGSTAWERCCLGLPTIAMILAPNQQAGAVALLDAGAVRLLEDGPDLNRSLAVLIQDLSEAQSLMALGIAAAAITDGAGITQVVEVMGHG